MARHNVSVLQSDSRFGVVMDRAHLVRNLCGSEVQGEALRRLLFQILSPLSARPRWPVHVLSYGAMRRVLYHEIGNADLYGAQQLEDIKYNCEHIYPQSAFGRRAPMRSDIHHCFPCGARHNSIRGSYRFGELDDDESSFLDATGRRVRMQSGDLCEVAHGLEAFEPGDLSKGNVARAIAYFRVAYPDFDDERMLATHTMLEWHRLDPVDAGEVKRTEVAAVYQGNVNPFIVCPELMERAFSAGPHPPAGSVPDVKAPRGAEAMEDSSAAPRPDAEVRLLLSEMKALGERAGAALLGQG